EGGPLHSQRYRDQVVQMHEPVPRRLPAARHRYARAAFHSSGQALARHRRNTRVAMAAGAAETERSIMRESKDEEESIFGHTETVFTTPELNAGVPRESWFIRALSNVEMTVSVILFA